jgi:hypothetical protein
MRNELVLLETKRSRHALSATPKTADYAARKKDANTPAAIDWRTPARGYKYLFASTW